MIAPLALAAVLGSGFSPGILGESGLIYHFADNLDLTGKEVVRYVMSMDRIAKETTKHARRFGPLTPQAAQISIFGTPVYVYPDNIECPIQSEERCTLEDGQPVCRSVVRQGFCRGAYYGMREIIKIAYNPCPARSSLSHELIHRVIHDWLGIMDYDHENRGLYYGPESVPEKVFRVVGCE